MNKVFLYLFAAFGIIAAIGIAFGAYWHLYTAAACWLMVYTLKNDKKKERNN